MTMRKARAKPRFPRPFARRAVALALILFLGLLCLGHQFLPLLLAQLFSNNTQTATSMQ